MGKLVIKKKTEEVIDDIQEEVIDEVSPIEDYDKFAGLDVEVSTPSYHYESSIPEEPIFNELVNSFVQEDLTPSYQPPAQPPAGQGYQEFKSSKRAIADIQSNPGWIKRILFLSLFAIVPSLVAGIAMTIIPFFGWLIALAIVLVSVVPTGYAMEYGRQYAVSKRNTMLPEHVITLDNFTSGLKAIVVALVVMLVGMILLMIVMTPIFLAGFIAPITKGMTFVGLGVGLLLFLIYIAIVALLLMLYYYCTYKVALSGRIRDGLHIFRNIGEMRNKHFIKNALLGPICATAALFVAITVGLTVITTVIMTFTLGAAGMSGILMGNYAGLTAIIPLFVVSLVAEVFMAAWSQRLNLIAFRAIAHEDMDEV